MKRGTTTLTIDSANGIKPGDHVCWKTKGCARQFGDVLEVYLSFKYPRGLTFWREATIQVAVVFVIRDRHKTDHHITDSRVSKSETLRHIK